jgi:hypothetical protein
MRDLARYVSRVVCIAAALPSALAGLASGPGGCSSTSAPSSGGSDAEAICPDTVAGAVGASCEVEGLVCSPQYTCGVVEVTARCVCTAGAFVCNDVTDAALTSPDATPVCPQRGDAEACPLLERSASLAACTETGLVCTYLAACDATPAFDQCQCMEGALANGTTGLRFQCSSPCTYVGPLVTTEGDAAVDALDSVPEAGANEGVSEASPTLDAAPDGSDDGRAPEASD